METIVITGANRGIGLELSRQFLQAGKRVIATCRRPEQASELNALGTERLRVLPLEVSDAGSLAAFRAKIGDETVDVLINNAGVMGGDLQGIADMDPAEWLRTFEVNTIAPFMLTTQLLPNLRRAPRPRVVTISSQMGAFGIEMGIGRYAYRSSKAAVSKVMQVLAQELKPENIIVCPVHPGWVQTDMGGARAELPVAASAAGLVRLIDGLTPEMSGRFWTWNGREHPW